MIQRISLNRVEGKVEGSVYLWVHLKTAAGAYNRARNHEPWSPRARPRRAREIRINNASSVPPPAYVNLPL